jgi:glycosyltransferase involved in cell wall biosynthesis
VNAGTVTIGFNALPLQPSGAGVSTYIRELLVALADRTDARLVPLVQASAAGDLPRSLRPVTRPDSAGLRRVLAGLVGLGSTDLDLYHGLDVDLPVRHRCPTVATVHDLSVFDAPTGVPRARVAGERLLVHHALRRADAVIAVSEFTASRVRERFGRTPTVVREAPGPDMVPPDAGELRTAREAFRLPDRFVLHVGSLDPRKNVDGLARACAAAGLPLVLAGGTLGCSPPPGTLPLGFVPRAQLPALYGAAELVAYVSVYEGFGLPPLEAMACGAAVVTTPVPAVTELVGDAACTVAAGDADGLADTIRALAADPARRAELADACRRRATTRSWGDVAEETLAVYRRVGVRC